jgi:hypothetical protein
VAKYNIVSVVFKQAIPAVGGSAWMANIKQAGVQSAEYDSTERLLTLHGTPKRRIPVEMIAEMVFGPTTSSKE